MTELYGEGAVEVCAPTFNMAAFNIAGKTVHRAFALPVPQPSTGGLQPLGPAPLHELQERLKDVRLIIIDKMSMIGRYS